MPRVVGVVGAAGQMGAGIAEVLERVAGCRVVRHDIAGGSTGGWEAVREAEFIIEAVPESLSVKKSVFDALEGAGCLRDAVVLASNTSSISITKLAALTPRPEQFIGMHFFNPVPRMEVVEVVCGLQTSAATLARTEALAQAMGKQPARCVHDSPGFVSNRVLMPYINEAVETLREGVASRDDIDRIMKLGTRVPMGPLALADFIGLDTCLAIMRVLEAGLPGGGARYKPSPLLVKYVDAGWLGRKTKRGFYEYP